MKVDLEIAGKIEAEEVTLGLPLLPRELQEWIAKMQQSLHIKASLAGKEISRWQRLI